GGRRPRGRNRQRERPHSRRDETVSSDPIAASEPAHDPAQIVAGDHATGDQPHGESHELSASEVAHQNEAHADDAHDDHAHDDHAHDDHADGDHTHHDHSHAEPAPVGETENPPVPAEIGTPVEHQDAHAAEAADGVASEEGHPPAEGGEHAAEGNGHDEEEEIVESVGGSD